MIPDDTGPKIVQKHASPRYAPSVVTVGDRQIMVYGYQNARSGELMYGYNPVIDVVADPNHPDNIGRLDTFDATHHYGRTEWRRVTDAAEWLRLKVAYEKESEYMASEAGVLIPVGAEMEARAAIAEGIRRQKQEADAQIAKALAEAAELSEADGMGRAALDALREDPEASAVIPENPADDAEFLKRIPVSQRGAPPAGRNRKVG